MKKLLSVTVLAFGLLSVNSACADRLLQCSNSAGRLTIGICGVRGCPSTITTRSGHRTNYNFTRFKNSDGSLRYSQRLGTTGRCTVDISRLQFGGRSIVSASCDTTLNGARCTITEVGGSTSSTTTN